MTTEPTLSSAGMVWKFEASEWRLCGSDGRIHAVVKRVQGNTGKGGGLLLGSTWLLCIEGSVHPFPTLDEAQNAVVLRPKAPPAMTGEQALAMLISLGVCPGCGSDMLPLREAGAAHEFPGSILGSCGYRAWPTGDAVEQGSRILFVRERHAEDFAKLKAHAEAKPDGQSMLGTPYPGLCG